MQSRYSESSTMVEGKIDQDLWRILEVNSRLPEAIKGDFGAQSLLTIWGIAIRICAGCLGAALSLRRTLRRLMPILALVLLAGPADAQDGPLKISGVFHASTSGQDVRFVPLVSDREFFDPDGTIASMARSGFTLVDVDIEIANSQRLFSAIFRSGVPSTQYWELTPVDFRNKVDELDQRGIRLIAVDSYFRNDALFYAGVFQQTATTQRFPGDQGWTEFTRSIDRYRAQGFTLADLTVFVSNGQERYLGIWRARSSGDGFWVSEWNSLAKQIELMGARGLRLSGMAHWSLGTSRKYAGVWVGQAGDEETVAATDVQAFRRKAAELAARPQPLVPVRILVETGYQPPVGLASAFHDRLDPLAIGYSYAISQGGQLIARGGVGFARAPWEPAGQFPGIRMSDATRMDIASVSKGIMATAALRLMQRSSRNCLTGRCNVSNFGLDTPISTILEGYSLGASVDRVTVGMLIDMTSNLNEGNCDDLHKTDLDEYAICVLANCTVDRGAGSSQCTPPPGRDSYNGVDFVMMRLVIEKLSGLDIETYLHRELFVPAGINDPNRSATDTANVNCNPQNVKRADQPLYYLADAAVSNSQGSILGDQRARSLKVCGAGAMQASIWQLDRFLRALTNGVNGGRPLLPATDLNRLMQSRLFQDHPAFAPIGNVRAKNGGFGWPPLPDWTSFSGGLVSSMVIVPAINTQLSGVVNTAGETYVQANNPWSKIKVDMQDTLIDGLARMYSRPEAMITVRARNNVRFGDMCLNVTQGALGDSTPSGSIVPIVQWTCGSPVAKNMQFVRRAIASGQFLLQAVHSGRCLTVGYASRSPDVPLVQHQCNGGSNAIFSLRPTSGGYSQIVAAHSGLCLEIKDGSAYSGALIVQNTCVRSRTSQEFRLVRVTN